MDEQTHQHKFVYGGVKYEVQRGMLAGSGAHPVAYFDWFYCELCLGNKYILLNIQANSYEKTLFNATPKQEGVASHT